MNSRSGPPRSDDEQSVPAEEPLADELLRQKLVDALHRDGFRALWGQGTTRVELRDLGTLRHIGKESNRLEDVQAGGIQSLEEVLNEYDDFYSSVFVPLVVPVLRDLGVRETARRTGHSVGAVSVALAGRSQPRTPQLAGYLKVAGEYARVWLDDRQIPIPADDVSCLRLYFDSAKLG